MPLGAFKAALMGTAGVSTADVVLLSTQTASSSASITFSSGIDSTYGEYIFGFYNIHPQTSGADLSFQVNATDTTSYNEDITSSAFWAYHMEDNSGAALIYAADHDQAQGTGYQNIGIDTAADADHSYNGHMHLFSPASTTYVKHFMSHVLACDEVRDQFVAGYINETTAIDDIQFKMNTGNIDAGVIKMWGVK